MFIKAFFTMVAADAVDRHVREQQHQTWIAQEQAQREAAASSPGLERPGSLPAGGLSGQNQIS